jgi:hypothetical protein
MRIRVRLDRRLVERMAASYAEQRIKAAVVEVARRIEQEYWPGRHRPWQDRTGGQRQW